MVFFNLYKKSKSNTTPDSLVDLCITIFKFSISLTNELIKIMSEQWKFKNISVIEVRTIEITMLAEFTFFHLAMTDRIASELLKNKRRNDLMGQLSLATRDIIIESYFKEWDEKSKENFKNNFLDGYNESQLRYSKGTQFIDKNKVFTGNGILSILGREIAEINESFQNTEIIMRTIELTTESFSQMNLKLLVENFRNS